MLSSPCNEGRRLMIISLSGIEQHRAQSNYQNLFYSIQYPSRATFIIIFSLLVLLLFYTDHKTPLKVMFCAVNLLSTTRY